MYSIPQIFSFLFFIVLVIYSFFGIYVLNNNPKDNLNRVFFAICIALGFWSIGFSLSVNAADAATCLFWRRISALGWGSAHSIILHFVLIMTGSRVLKHRWIYPLIYFPAAVFIYVYSVSQQMAPKLYDFVNKGYGWINISQSSAWDIFFNIYYISFAVSSVYVLWKLGWESSDEIVKKKSKLISTSFLIAYFLGTITDILPDTYLAIRIPQMAPIIILIPITAIFYSIKKYGMMKIKVFKDEELIINEVNRAKIYQTLTISITAGGFINIFCRYFIYRSNILHTFTFSAELFFAGILVQIILKSKLKNDWQDNLILIFAAILVPVIILQFVQYASMTIWAAPFILIIIFIVFDKRIMLAVLSVSILITIVSVWIIAPTKQVYVEGSDHFVRVALYVIAIWVAFYVNKIYRLRLKENADQILIQKLISDISSELVTINTINKNEKINTIICKTGIFFNVDRINVGILDHNNSSIIKKYDWCRDIFARKGNVQDILLDSFQWMASIILNNEYVYIPEVENLPEEAINEKLMFMDYNIRSVIAVPLNVEGKVQGFISLNSIKSLKKWNDGQINILKIISNVLGDAFTKVNAEDQQNYMAYYDQLTALPNRILFKDRVEQSIRTSRRTNKIFGVIFFDLDSFKAVNDTLGHDSGDSLLKTIAQELLCTVRESDTVARFGGDEFLILLNNISNGEDIIKIADKFMDIFKKPFNINGQEFFVTASAGIAVYPVDGTVVDILIKNADLAMYNAKERGKNQYAICSSDMKEEVRRIIELSNKLYRAQEKNELILYYQPQIDVQSGEIAGLEALLRWEHPELGMVQPDVFIPIAENTGLINPIGEWVLRTACMQNKRWQEMGFKHVRVAVNVSFVQFKNTRFLKLVENVLDDTGLNPEYLELEITESVATQELNYVVDIINRLKALGVSIAIDDFGTEYSSLSRLKLLPVDRIKMDMQFVRGIDGGNKDQAIAKIIINLAKNLGIKLIAEGVETQTQHDFLSQRMCDEIQGFYYYKPMPAEDIEDLLQNDNSTVRSQIL